MIPHGNVFRGLSRLRDLGFSPTNILDVGAYTAQFAREAREIWKDAYIFMIDAMPEQEPILASACRELGNADYLITMLGEREMEAASFFVADTKLRPDLIKSGSSKFRENNAFPWDERMLPQRTLDSVVNDCGRSFQLLKLDVQGAELEVLNGFRGHLPNIEVILMELSLVDYNKGAPLIDVMLGELRQMDFVVYDLLRGATIRRTFISN